MSLGVLTPAVSVPLYSLAEPFGKVAAASFFLARISVSV